MNFANKQPIYMQIADYFCESILKNEWKPNDKLPSVREIAVQVEVNPNTAIRAFTYLQDKGIIFNKRGLGYYVSQEGYEKALQMRKDQFFELDLPFFIKTMQLIGLSPQDFVQLSQSINH
jgi:DNA-binding transcriptional regulator YhcF (GntR family)